MQQQPHLSTHVHGADKPRWIVCVRSTSAFVPPLTCRVSQTLDFEKQTLESSFDTTIFGLTVIPILGWFKLVREQAVQLNPASCARSGSTSW